MAATENPAVNHFFEEWNRLRAGFALGISEHPDKIAETLVLLHQEPEGLLRYAHADVLYESFQGRDFNNHIILRRVYVACTTGVPLAVLNILLDAQTYIWESSSEFSHPGLGMYIVWMLRILMSCCREIAASRPADFDGAFKEPISQILSGCPSLWRILWLHRHRLFDPEYGGSELSIKTHNQMRGGLYLLLNEIISINIRHLGDNKQPSVVFDYVAELMLYTWQYEKNITYSELAVEVMFTVFTESEPEKYEEPMSKAITDEVTAGRLSRNICDNLVHERTLDTQLAEMLFILCVFLRNNDLLALSRKGNYLKSVAVALQKQLCSGIYVKLDMRTMRYGLQALVILLVHRGPNLPLLAAGPTPT
ncbi:hypothetical protein NLI96_g9059 [Meripilus lineatus]|uniref:Uncharacterized protein n=1 Tax=Meripilus lineatus TaxID=2056292 RepID=A0AAD5YDA3_9APHY|nr:hypothetical protein NLI96_g9059 [Physisporinus lineatus]